MEKKTYTVDCIDLELQKSNEIDSKYGYFHLCLISLFILQNTANLEVCSNYGFIQVIAVLVTQNILYIVVINDLSLNQIFPVVNKVLKE